MATRTWEIFEIQVNALATRLAATGIKELVLGVSGGLDSTQAALVAAAAMDTLDLPRENLLCVTMPGLGTSADTRSNAEVLTKSLGASFMDVSVSDASHLVLRSVEHPAAENADDVQALIENIRANPEVGDVALECPSPPSHTRSNDARELARGRWSSEPVT